jgi:hypothetical protein
LDNKVEDKEKLLINFMRSLTDQELEANDPKYVPDLHNDEQSGDPVEQLAWQIKTVDGASIYFFSGMIGSGKSTELKRLQKTLEDDGHIAIYVDMARYINVGSPVGVPDLLMGIAGAFSEEASKILGQNVVIENYWDRAINFLESNINLKETGIIGEISPAPGTKLGINLKAELDRNPSFKAKLQKQMQGVVGKFVEDVRRYIADIANKLAATKAKGARLVLILDSLERIQGEGKATDPVMMSVRKLFRENLDELYLPPLKIVYPVAPYLLKLEPNILSRVDAANLCTLTCIPVFERRTMKPRQAAINQLVNLVEKRFSDWPKILSRPQLEELILMSGGDLRELLLLLRTMVTRVATQIESTLPVDKKDIENAIISVRRNRLPVSEALRLRLQPIYVDGQIALGDDADYDGFIADLTVKRILMYRNGEEWYGVHPLLWDEMKKHQPTIVNG